MTTAQAAVGQNNSLPFAHHLDGYDQHLQAKGVTAHHRTGTLSYLRRLAADCSFSKLADLHREALERWLALRIAEGMSARARNAHRNAVVSFCNWCIDT